VEKTKKKLDKKISTYKYIVPTPCFSMYLFSLFFIGYYYYHYYHIITITVITTTFTITVITTAAATANCYYVVYRMVESWIAAIYSGRSAIYLSRRARDEDEATYTDGVSRISITAPHSNFFVSFRTG